MWNKFKTWLHLKTCPHKVCITVDWCIMDNWVMKQCVCCEKNIYDTYDDFKV